MPGRGRSSLGFRTPTEALRRFIANQTEVERASANERRRQRMAQMRVERRAVVNISQLWRVMSTNSQISPVSLGDLIVALVD